MDNDWIGTRVRKGDMIGKIINDSNWRYRILTVQFENGTKEDITLNNIGPDPESVHQYEWECELEGKKIWYRF